MRSIGDGDVVFLAEPKQLGRLVSIKPSDGNRKVRATFEFQRDAVGYRNERFLAFDYPNGAVSNIDGETSIGLALRDTRFTNIPLWKNPNEAQLSTGFIPLGPLDSSLESYRFRIIYQSAASPLNQSDFDRNHLIVTPEKLEAPSLLKPSSIETAYLRSGNDVVQSIVRKQVLDDLKTALAYYRVDKPDDDWPQIFRIQILNGGVRDSEGRTISNQEVAVVGRNDLKAVDAELISGQLIEGDPDSHLLSFLVQVRPEWYVLWPANPLLGSNFRTFEDAYPNPMLDWDSEILPALEGGEMAPPALGSFDSLRPAGYRTPSPSFNFTNDKVVMNLRINRPDDGWDAWDLGRVPYVVHAPRLKNVPSSVIASGFVALADSTKAALLFSFEDWVRRLEERAELPDGSLAGDAGRDGQDGLTELVIGSDLQDAQDTGTIKPSTLKKNGERYACLRFPIRTNNLGVTAELQHSTDGQQWRSVDDEFEVVDRAPKQDGTAEIHLIAKEPLAGNANLGLFRIAAVR